MYNIYVKLPIDNTTAVGINHKELYNCQWDPMTLTTHCIQPHLSFYKHKYIDLMLACIGRN